MTEDTIKQIAQRFGAIYEDRIVFHDDKFTEFAEAVVAALESRVLAESDKQEAADAKPVAQIVGDDKTRRLIWRCNAFDYDAGTELYAHPIASADVRDAERWRETLKHIGLWLSGGRRMVWAFGDGIPVPPETDYYKDSAAQRFVQAIDAALSQASKGNEND